ACCSLGRRATNIEMKMMLSMPRTISRAVRVKKATQISGLVSHSIQSNLVSIEWRKLGIAPAAHHFLEKKRVGDLHQCAATLFGKVFKSGIEHVDRDNTAF